MQKSDVIYNRKRYDNSTQFYRDYFGRDIDALVNSIKKYKQTHGAHNKDEAASGQLGPKFDEAKEDTEHEK